MPSDSAPEGVLPDLYEVSIAELQDGLRGKRFTSVELVQAYFARIDEVNDKGPKLHAVIEKNRKAIEEAELRDMERTNGTSKGMLHGIPIIIKDNIATRKSDGMNTTAGAEVLENRFPPGDATVVKKLREAGAIILGKANQSEWSYFRDKSIPSGYSGRGKQCTSPYVVHGDPSGSSSGSAVCTAIGLAAASLGTETAGSIVSPSSRNNLVGIKPTVCLTSRSGVIPISANQDSVGPITRTVEDAAIILSAIAGYDPNDPPLAGLEPPQEIPDYAKDLKNYPLSGKKLGIPVKYLTKDKNIIYDFMRAIGVMASRGAKISFTNLGPELDELPNDNIVLYADCKVGLEAYFADLDQEDPKVLNLQDVFDFNDLNPDGYGQSRLEKAHQTEKDQAYEDALASNKRFGREDGIDAILDQEGLDALIIPTDSNWQLSSLAGYPIISVPLGFQPDDVPLKPEPHGAPFRVAPGCPYGIAFTGRRFSESLLFGLAYDFEQALKSEPELGLGRLGRKAYAAAIPKTQLQQAKR